MGLAERPYMRKDRGKPKRGYKIPPYKATIVKGGKSKYWIVGLILIFFVLMVISVMLI